jgi:hypothetical protein
MLREVKSVTRQQEMNNEQSVGKIVTLLKLKDRTQQPPFCDFSDDADRRRGDECHKDTTPQSSVKLFDCLRTYKYVGEKEKIDLMWRWQSLYEADPFDLTNG